MKGSGRGDHVLYTIILYMCNIYFSYNVHVYINTYTCIFSENPLYYWCLVLYVVLCCRNIDTLGAKEMVMGMVNHGNSEVRMQALISIQKMMVQNWYVLMNPSSITQCDMQCHCTNFSFL